MKKTFLIAVMMLGSVNKKSRNQEIKKIKVQTNEKLSRLTSVAQKCKALSERCLIQHPSEGLKVVYTSLYVRLKPHLHFGGN